MVREQRSNSKQESMDGHSSSKNPSSSSTTSSSNTNGNVTSSSSSSSKKAAKTTGPLHNQRYKMKLCQHFDIHGHCPYNEKCQFAHGKQELDKWINRRKRQEAAAAAAASSTSGNATTSSSRRGSTSSIASTDSMYSTPPNNSSSRQQATSSMASSSSQDDRAKMNDTLLLKSSSKNDLTQQQHTYSALWNEFNSASSLSQTSRAAPSASFDLEDHQNRNYEQEQQQHQGQGSDSMTPYLSSLHMWDDSSTHPSVTNDSIFGNDTFSPVISPSYPSHIRELSPWASQPLGADGLFSKMSLSNPSSSGGVMLPISPLRTPQMPSNGNNPLSSFLSDEITSTNTTKSAAPTSQLFGMRTMFPSSINDCL